VTLETSPFWPLSSRPTCRPVAAVPEVGVAFRSPVAICLPSGEKRIATIPSPWGIACSSSWLRMFQTEILPLLSQPELVGEDVPVAVDLVVADASGDEVEAAQVGEREPSCAGDELVIEPCPDSLGGA
jgi:hypothetical protein